VNIGKYQSEKFPIQNGLKQEDPLSPLLLLCLEYDIRRVQENQEWLKLNGTHQNLVSTDYVRIVVENIDTLKRNTEAILGASRKVDLEENPEKTKCILMLCSQKIGHKHS
jgi:hypothetical protein